MPAIMTTLGPKRSSDLGLILAHEHIFANFDSRDHPAAGVIPAAAVLALMGPFLAAARQAGITALVDATSIGGARRAELLRAVSAAVDLPVVVATGIFREPWISQWVAQYGEEGLAAWMLREITTGIGADEEIRQLETLPLGSAVAPALLAQAGSVTGTVRAGWIKLRAGDEELSPAQTVLVRAAARASLAGGVAIGSHTVAGHVAARQVDVIEAAGCAADRFIWIHAQVERDFAWNLALARRGVWIEYDGIGDSPADEVYIERIVRMWEAGCGHRILLSQDRGWYDPMRPGGGVPKPYTYLTDTFLPKLQAAGVSEEQIRQMTVHNPFAAYATDDALWD